MHTDIKELQIELSKIVAELNENKEEAEFVLFSLLNDLQSKINLFKNLNNQHAEYNHIKTLFNFKKEISRPSFQDFITIYQYLKSVDKKFNLSKPYFCLLLLSNIELTQFYYKAFISEFDKDKISLIKEIVKINKDMYNPLNEYIEKDF